MADNNHIARTYLSRSSAVRLLLMLTCVALLPGCLSKTRRDQSATVTQELADRKNKTDNLRSAMRHLALMSPANRGPTTKEIQLALNTWLQNVDPSSVNYSPSELLQPLPMDMMTAVGCRTPVELQFNYWDIDYLFECRMMNQLADWIVKFPLRDSVVLPIVEEKKRTLDAGGGVKLEEACKLFDWTMRNVALEDNASSVEEITTDPRGAVTEVGVGIGYSYLPWETVLFSFGDFVERGRAFMALAQQRGIETAWISVGADGGPGNLWAIGVVIGDSMLLFEPKLAMPILDPDSGQFATLEEARTNDRILRRLDLPGQFDYAFNPGDLTSLELLISLPPTAASARMKMLERVLIRDERMVVYHDIDALSDSLRRVAKTDKIRLWQVPLMAQINAIGVREQLRTHNAFTNYYTAMHGVWLMSTPVSEGRLKHLKGEFEATSDREGAFTLYMDSRYSDEALENLARNPALQKELGVPREPGEELEQYQIKLQQAALVFKKTKGDVAFLLGQLHFDRGNYEAAENWFRKRVIDAILAGQWQAAGHTYLGRVYQEMGHLEKATEQFTHQPNPQEAGNRLRLRYLRRLLEPK